MMEVIVGFAAFLILFYGPVVLYFKLGLFKGFYHDIMGWHKPDYSKDSWDDGCSLHAVCKYCEKEIMQDSQGNWFTYDGGVSDD